MMSLPVINGTPPPTVPPPDSNPPDSTPPPRQLHPLVQHHHLPFNKRAVRYRNAFLFFYYSRIFTLPDFNPGSTTE